MFFVEGMRDDLHLRTYNGFRVPKPTHEVLKPMGQGLPFVVSVFKKVLTIMAAMDH